jgi:hypothetical protein
VAEAEAAAAAEAEEELTGPDVIDVAEVDETETAAPENDSAENEVDDVSDEPAAEVVDMDDEDEDDTATADAETGEKGE